MTRNFWGCEGMSAKAIREYDGKLLLSRNLNGCENTRPISIAQIKIERSSATRNGELDSVESRSLIDGQLESQFAEVEAKFSWIRTSKLVVKPDMLIKRRGKSGIILLDADWGSAKQWIKEIARNRVTVASLLRRWKVSLAISMPS
jgi:ATP citrate (pro-S)-lyase